MLQVEQVVTKATEHLIDSVRISIIECSIGRYTRTNLIKVTVTGVTLHNLINVIFPLRTGTNESHLADEYVPQLGKFIQMVFAQEFTNLCQTSILTALIQRRAGFLRVQPHASEFVDIERTTETPDALLLENSRTAVLMLHRNIAYQEQRREDNQRNKS